MTAPPAGALEACLALLEKALERTVYSSSAQVPDAPLKVFDSGPWIYEPDGVRFSGQQLDGAAFAEYRRLLAAAPAAPKGGVVDRLRSALQAIADYADDPNTPVRNSVKKSALARAAIATGEQP